MSRIDSIGAPQHFPGTQLMCAGDAGWHSLSLRKYSYAPSAEEFEIPPTFDQLIGLVTNGCGIFEKVSLGKWQRVRKVMGGVYHAPVGEPMRTRWRGIERLEAVHLCIPAATMQAAAEELRDTRSAPKSLALTIPTDDPVVAATLLSLERAVVNRMPDLYAESAAHFLALHLRSGPARATLSIARNREGERLRRVDDFMRAHLDAPLSLSGLARVAGCSTFQLIRFCRSSWRETPFGRLSRLRMERAQLLLRHTAADIMTIALECGYENPSHFATSFRRIVGISPSQFRRD